MSCLASLPFHNQICRRLSYAIMTGEISHAYLFTGEQGTGKTPLAKAFAADLLASGHPDALSLFKTGQHPDFLLVEKKGASIAVEDIRRMEEWLSRKPYWGERRVVFIRDAQYLRREAGNALLKTLEEPPEYAVFILVVDGELSFSTIVSRCQLIHVTPLPEGYVEEEFKKNGFGEDIAKLAAKVSAGNIDDGRLLLAEGIDILLKEVKDFFNEAANGRYHAVILKAEELEKNNNRRRAFYIALRYLLHQVAMPEAVRDKGCEALPHVKPEKVLEVLNHIDQIKGYERVNANQLLMSIEMLWQVFALLRSA